MTSIKTDNLSLGTALQHGLANLIYGPFGRLVGVIVLILALGHFVFGRGPRGLLLLLGLFLFFLLPALI